MGPGGKQLIKWALVIDFQGSRCLSLAGSSAGVQAAWEPGLCLCKELFDATHSLGPGGTQQASGLASFPPPPLCPANQWGCTPLSWATTSAPDYILRNLRAGYSKQCLAWELRKKGRKPHLTFEVTRP